MNWLDYVYKRELYADFVRQAERNRRRPRCRGRWGAWFTATFVRIRQLGKAAQSAALPQPATCTRYDAERREECCDGGVVAHRGAAGMLTTCCTEEADLDIRRLAWLGVPTRQFAETVAFFETSLGISLERREQDFAILRLPDCTAIEVFGPQLAKQEQFTAGPVIGLEVWDVVAARQQLEASGVAFIGPIHSGDRGAAWTHMRGPEGKVYELTQLPATQRATL